MKRVQLNSLLTFCLLLFLVSSCAGVKAKTIEKQTIVEKNGALRVQGTQLMNKNGEPVMLKGVSYGWHNLWPRFYNAQSVKALVDDWNCTVLRAAIGVEMKGSYLQAPDEAIRCATVVADAAIASGVYVILDFHSHHIRLEAAQAFFTEMAIRYQGVPNVIYEIFNEPVNDSWADVKAYSEEVIRTIRAIEPNALILVGTPHWDQDIHLAADDPITGPTNLMYSLHFYAATHKQGLRDRADYALNKGLPLFVSECAGMEASGDGPIDMESWAAWLRWMEQHQISWAAWSISDKPETCSMMLTGASSEGPWQGPVLREWGRMVHTELKSTVKP